MNIIDCMSNDGYFILCFSIYYLSVIFVVSVSFIILLVLLKLLCSASLENYKCNHKYKIKIVKYKYHWSLSEMTYQ